MTIQKVPFLDVFEDESGGNIKTPQSEYLPVGKYPVIDQGKTLVAGFVDDKSRLCGDGRPAIVFGDHTRCVKYAGFPFCMGADGVKVLRPKIEADLKYLYYFLRQLDIPNAGYDRHYKYLKRTEVALQPLSEQRRIAAILDQADALRAKRRENLTQLDSLTQSIFIEMFGDHSSNPEEFPITPMEEISERITKGESPGWQGFEYQDDGALFVTSENVRLGSIDLSSPKFVPLEFNKKLSRSELKADDLLVNLVGASIGRSCIFPGFDRPANVNQAVAVVTAKRNLIHPVYLSHFLTSTFGQRILLGNRVEGARANISLTDLREIFVPLPSMHLQEQFVERVSAVERIRVSGKDSLSQFDALFNAIQYRAFAGEL